MSTRCNICAYIDDRLYCIYCHHDGYPEGVGQTLLDYWYEPEEIKKLVTTNGEISSLANSFDKQEYYDDSKPPKIFIDEFSMNIPWDIEYVYVWRNGKWKVKDLHFKDLREVLDDN